MITRLPNTISVTYESAPEGTSATKRFSSPTGSFDDVSYAVRCENGTVKVSVGVEWARTRKMGVNTLAFRMMQNGTFYAADADCVGIMGKFPWEYNGQWLKLLSRSGSPLFVSCKPDVPTEAEFDDIREGFRVNSVQSDRAVPLDWMESVCPEKWLINGEEVSFRWF